MSNTAKAVAILLMGVLLAATSWLALRGADAAEASDLLPGQGFLPDNRAWEMVSPPDKNGGDVLSDAGRTRAATDGNAAGFVSLAGFGDVAGTGLAVDYIARRTAEPGTNGWATHSITPAHPADTLQGTLSGHDGAYEGEFSPDLSRAVYRSFLPIYDAAENEELTPNLYVRDDVLVSGPGSYQLSTPASASVCSPPPLPCTQPLTGIPFLAGTSADFSSVLFESRLNLTADASGSNTKLYEWEKDAVPPLRLSSILPDDTPSVNARAGVGAASRLYTQNMISADGRRVFFRHNPTGNVYMRLDGSSTIQLNESEKTSSESPQAATLWTASTDGSRVFFTTSEGLVDGDDDGSADLYMNETAAPAGSRLTRLSVDLEPGDGHTVLSVVGASADGSYVYFFSGGQLVAGEPVLGAGRGLYVWHDGAIDYVGLFANGQDTPKNSLDTSWNIATSAATARVTPDGRHVVFMSRSDAGFAGRGGFDGYDHGTSCTFDTGAGGPCREIYVYSADDGAIACASCAPSGGTATADAHIQARYGGVAISTSHRSRAISDDGRRVFFSTAEALVPEDTNGKSDAYMYDVPSGTPHLISTGTDPSGSYFLDASSSGDDVFFTTREQLVGWDVDSSYDLYDARVGGGMAEPPPVASPCEGDGCQDEPSASPTRPSAASADFTGRGNPDSPSEPERTALGVRRSKASARLSTRLKVRVPGPGRISVAGRGMRRTSRSVANAGSYPLRIVLNSRAKKRLKKRTLTVRARVSYRATDGNRNLKKTIKVTFKRAKKSSASRANTNRRAGR